MNDLNSTSSRFIIDRFEDDGWAVLEVEASSTIDVPTDWLPTNSQEGDILRLQVQRNGNTSEVTFVIDQDETEERTRRIKGKLDQLRGE